MDVSEKEVTDPQYILDKIDWEGWPDALEWLVNDNFGDEELNQLIYDATQLHTQLNYLHNQIEDRVEELLGEE